jgi:lysophospholipase L1-like esterase
MKIFYSMGISAFAAIMLGAAPGQAQTHANSLQMAEGTVRTPSVAIAQEAGQQAQSSTQAGCDCAELAATKEHLEYARKMLADWPDLARYRDANAKLQPPGKKESRVVFMGDSITDIWQNPEFGGFFPGKPYVDRGISGQTTPQMLIRFRPDVIALQPKVVVILAGTNDLAGNTGPEPVSEIEDNLASMAQLARANKIRVVLASITPVSDYGHNREGKPLVMTDRRPPDKILEIDAWLKKYCAENKFTYLDYFSALADEKGFFKSDLSNDGLHPNAKGYAVMAPLAEQAIAASLKQKP